MTTETKQSNTKLDELIDNGGKFKKTTSETHQPRSVTEEKDEMYPGPKLTRQSLREVTTGSLRLPKNGHPDYSYIWLSMDPRFKPNLQDAVQNLGYTVCSIQELPEMAIYVHNTMDNSLYSGKIVYKEMVLCKQHKQDRLVVLQEYHHDKPLEQAADVYQKFNGLVENHARNGHAVPLSKADRSGDYADNVEERVLNGNRVKTADSEETGIITEGKDVRRVQPKFEI